MRRVAVVFLALTSVLSTQAADRSWPMASRPGPPAYPLSAEGLETYDVEAVRKMPPAKGCPADFKAEQLVRHVLEHCDGWLPKEFVKVLMPEEPKSRKANAQN